MESSASDFATQYAVLSDSELLAIKAERGTLKQSAALALDAEIGRRGLSDALTSEPRSDSPELSLDGELPYRWGRFVGGMTLVSALLAGVAALMEKDFVGIIGAGVSAGVGLGIYHMRKWAVLLLEIGTCLSVIIIVAMLLAESRQGKADSIVGLGTLTLFAVIFSAPQTIYFWKRRNQLR